jgi:hypothetical protein
MMKKCSICGDSYPPEDMIGDICISCGGSIMHNDDIPPNFDL